MAASVAQRPDRSVFARCYYTRRTIARYMQAIKQATASAVIIVRLLPAPVKQLSSSNCVANKSCITSLMIVLTGNHPLPTTLLVPASGVS
jgi:hypothetical protein